MKQTLLVSQKDYSTHKALDLEVPYATVQVRRIAGEEVHENDFNNDHLRHITFHKPLVVRELTFGSSESAFR